MWNRTKKALAWSIALVGVLQYAKALSVAPADLSKIGRTSPLIVIAEPKENLKYEIIDEHSVYIYTTYKVMSVKKDILRDYDTSESNLIEIRTRHPDDYGIGATSSTEFIKQHKRMTKESYYKHEPRILLLSLTKSGEWTLARPYFNPLSKDKLDSMIEAGTFEPVGIDGLETKYTLAEWQKIANANVLRQYYELDFSRERPETWPKTFKEAVAIASIVVENKGGIPITGTYPYTTTIHERIGLSTPRDKKRSEWYINKTLLLNMGRISPEDARVEIVEAAMSQLKKRYPISFEEDWSSIKIKKLYYQHKLLSECLNDLIQKAGEISQYRIDIAPEVADRKVNITLRNLNVFQCLQFVTDQAGCAVVAELPIGDEVVIHVIDVPQ